jgi:hypothetical protein
MDERGTRRYESIPQFVNLYPRLYGRDSPDEQVSFRQASVGAWYTIN